MRLVLSPWAAETATSLTHVRQPAAGHERVDAVERRRRADEQLAAVLAAPREVRPALGELDRAEVLALRRDDPDPARAGHPDVAARVALHAVRVPLEAFRVRLLEEHAPVLGAAVAPVVDPDVHPRQVVHVEE